MEVPDTMLHLSVHSFLQISERLKYEVTYHKCNGSWPQSTVGGSWTFLAIDGASRCWASSPSSIAPTSLHPGHLCSRPKHRRGQMRDGSHGWGSTSCSQAQTAAPAHPSWAQLIMQNHHSHIHSRCSEKWEMGKRSTAACSLHCSISKLFSLYLEKVVYIWFCCMKDKICCFQLCHRTRCRKAQTLTKGHSKALSASEFFVCSPGFSCLIVTGSGKNFLWLIRF